MFQVPGFRWLKDAPATRVPGVSETHVPDIADGDLKLPRLMGNGRLILPCLKKDDNASIFLNNSKQIPCGWSGNRKQRYFLRVICALF